MRRRSFFMLIKIKAEDLKHRIIIPIPLFLVTELLEGLTCCMNIYKKVNKKPHWTRFLPDNIPYLGESLKDLDEVKLLELATMLVDELRNYGRFTLLEVKDGENHVKISML